MDDTPPPRTAPRPADPLPCIAIIGAGFSGAALAAQLLRQAQRPLQVLLINESGRMARGLAYGTNSRAHVLNVPAGNMSAIAEEPDDFVRYCGWARPGTQPGEFVPRPLYGAYLEALLSGAELLATEGCRLDRVGGRAQALQRQGRGWQITLADGRTLAADDVVLAFGHFAPEHPLDAAARTQAGARYVADPWAAQALQAIGPDDRVLLVGAGLTAVDVVLSLQQRGHRGALTLVSRRGLPAQGHRATLPGRHPLDAAALAQAMAGSARRGLRALRAAVAAHEAGGGDWRDVIGALRPHTPRLWQALPEAERRRFLRHLRVHWDTARHRCAPGANAVVQALQQDGRLRLVAGRIRAVTAEPAASLRVAVARRGQPGAPELLPVEAIVNCTGPSADLTRSGSALVQALLADGLIQADPLRQGLQVDAQYRPLGADGQPAAGLYYLGPLLKARDWEATAVPELRQHAAALARQLLRPPQPA